ncbi:MAG: enoyl-CoA hydratase/isomerase family protein [Acetobacter papayae]|uniref:enoyl-CoA hydratase/isomerase family protein n=1 Tax=Acetobacter papayae TaxID=1076592 RepID=UPI0039ECB353
MTEAVLSEVEGLAVSRVGHMGRLVLDRPKKLNALDAGLAQGISQALDAWRDDDSVQVVLIESSSPRAFCAGGDLRAIREALLAQGVGRAFALMDRAYDTMRQLATYPKPVVSFLDGITMGGGVGLGCHVPWRVVTERSVLAMPETGIGLVPDAGGSWLLSRTQGLAGLRLALTGGRMDGAQAVAMGLADIHTHSEALDSLRAALAHTLPEQVFASVQSDAPAKAAVALSPELEQCYAAATVAEVMERLQACDLPQAQQDLEDMRRASPFSLEAAWHGWHRARQVDTLDAAFDVERSLVRLVLERPDIAEGIRARLVDRDNAPVWQPARLADIPAPVLQALHVL